MRTRGSSPGGSSSYQRPPSSLPLTPTLRTLYENRADKTIFVNADGSLRYGEVVQIIDAAIGVGLRVGIVTEGMKTEAQGKKGG